MASNGPCGRLSLHIANVGVTAFNLLYLLLLPILFQIHLTLKLYLLLHFEGLEEVFLNPENLVVFHLA